MQQRKLPISTVYLLEVFAFSLLGFWLRGKLDQLTAGYGLAGVGLVALRLLVFALLIALAVTFHRLLFRFLRSRGWVRD